MGDIELNPKALAWGDIICHQVGGNAVSAGQGFCMTLKTIFSVGVARTSASYKWNHISIVTDKHGTFGPMAQNLGIAHAHAVNNGVNIEDLPHRGKFRVYRHRENRIALEAAKIAYRWSSKDFTDWSNYTMSAALASGTRMNFFGPFAAASADAFFARRNDTFTKSDNFSSFCSMFVAACYQAVEGSKGCRTYMGVDATAITPMGLVSYLKDNPKPWDMVIDFSSGMTGIKPQTYAWR